MADWFRCFLLCLGASLAIAANGGCAPKAATSRSPGVDGPRRSDSTEWTVAVSGKPDVVWTRERVEKDLAAEFQEVPLDQHGERHAARGVLLTALLRASGCPVDFHMDPSADPKTKLEPVRMVVLVRARDGYSVAFSLAELLPQVGRRKVWAIADIDGRPLESRDGPVKLYVADDASPVRNVRSVDRIDAFVAHP